MNQPNDHTSRISARATGMAPGAPGAGKPAPQASRTMVARSHPASVKTGAAAGVTGTEPQGVSGTRIQQGGGTGTGKGDRGGSGGNRKRTILIVAACVVAALAVWLLVWLFACNGSSLFDPTAQTGQAPYKSDEEMQAELDRVVEEGMFNISIASTIQFANGTSAGTAYIENVPGNHYNMQVAITDDATGEVLYESGVLAPNQYIQDITLARDLEPGTYEATASFTALDPTTYDEVGQAAAKIAIVVQE